jgi:hypothetical protein
MGKTAFGLHYQFGNNESYRGWFIPFVSLDIRFWQLGSGMDSWKLQVTSSLCHVNASMLLRKKSYYNNTFSLFSFPLVMNIMQFWVIDTFIKHKTDKAGQNIRLTRDEEDAETLLRSHEDDEEREEEMEEPTDPPPRYSIDDINDASSFENMNHPGTFLQASSSSEIPSVTGNEYELKSKKH